MKINEVTSPLSKINKFLDNKKKREEYARKLQQQRDAEDKEKVAEAKDWTDKRNWPIGLMVKHPKPEITQWYKWDGQQWISKGAGYPVSELDPEIEPFQRRNDRNPPSRLFVDFQFHRDQAVDFHHVSETENPFQPGGHPLKRLVTGINHLRPLTNYPETQHHQ